MVSYTVKARSLAFGKDREQAIALFLNAEGAVKSVQRLAVGSRGLVDVEIECIIDSARATEASSFVLVHNHPSGALHASGADVAATRAIHQAAAGAGIPLRDHLVYANGQVASILGARRGQPCEGCALTLRDFPGNAGAATMKRAHARAKEIRKSGEKYPEALKRAWGDLKAQGQADFPGTHGVAHQQDAHALAWSIRKDGEPYNEALRRAWAQLRRNGAAKPVTRTPPILARKSPPEPPP